MRVMSPSWEGMGTISLMNGVPLIWFQKTQEKQLWCTNGQSKPRNWFLVQNWFKASIVVVMGAFVIPIEQGQWIRWTDVSWWWRYDVVCLTLTAKVSLEIDFWQKMGSRKVFLVVLYEFVIPIEQHKWMRWIAVSWWWKCDVVCLNINSRQKRCVIIHQRPE